MSTTFTPKSTSNKIKFTFDGEMYNSKAARSISLTFWEGTTCVGTSSWLQASNGSAPIHAGFEFTPASATSETYTIRWGVSAATGYINRSSSYTPNFGGTQEAYMTLEEFSGTTYETYTDPV